MKNSEQTIISASDRCGRQMSIVLLSSGQYAISCDGHTLSDFVWEASAPSKSAHKLCSA